MIAAVSSTPTGRDITPLRGLEPAAARFDALLRELRAQGVGALAINADPVVRQFIDGRADGPLPIW